MQEKEALAHAPQWGGAELVRTGCPLKDAIRQTGAHVVEREIRERLVSHAAHARENRIRCSERRPVAQRAPDRVERIGAILRVSGLGAGAGGAERRMKTAKAH